MFGLLNIGDINRNKSLLSLWKIAYYKMHVNFVLFISEIFSLQEKYEFFIRITYFIYFYFYR